MGVELEPTRHAVSSELCDAFLAVLTEAQCGSQRGYPPVATLLDPLTLFVRGDMFEWLQGGMKHAKPVPAVPGLRNATHVWFNNFGDTFTTNGGNVRFCQAICQDVRVVDALRVVVLFWLFSSSSFLCRVCLCGCS